MVDVVPSAEGFDAAVRSRFRRHFDQVYEFTTQGWAADQEPQELWTILPFATEWPRQG